jgi:toxin ParE1/3/4
MKVRYTRQALSDISLIADYIRERNPAAAVTVETAIRSTIALLADYPKIGRERRELGVRSLGIPRHPYTAYYHIEGNEVWVVHVRDDRRRPPEPGDA